MSEITISNINNILLTLFRVTFLLLMDAFLQFVPKHLFRFDNLFSHEFELDYILFQAGLELFKAVTNLDSIIEVQLLLEEGR